MRLLRTYQLTSGCPAAEFDATTETQTADEDPINPRNREEQRQGQK
jgi:hypothetical protein